LLKLKTKIIFSDSNLDLYKFKKEIYSVVMKLLVSEEFTKCRNVLKTFFELPTKTVTDFLDFNIWLSNSTIKILLSIGTKNFPS
jgi:hypothetical protein